MGIFSDAQGQLTLQSMVESGLSWNSSEILWLSSLPAKMIKIQSKMKEIECSHYFSHYKSMGIFSDAQRHLNPWLILAKIQTRLRYYGCPLYLQV